MFFQDGTEAIVYSNEEIDTDQNMESNFQTIIRTKEPEHLYVVPDDDIVSSSNHYDLLNSYKRNKETDVGFSVDSESAMFGQYISVELASVKDYASIQRAKFEINKIIYKLKTGQYSDKSNQGTSTDDDLDTSDLKANIHWL